MLRKSLVGFGAVLASFTAGGNYQPVRSHDNTTPEERQMRRFFEAEGIHAVLLVSGASSAAPIKLGTEPSALEMKIGENGIQFLNISSATSSIYLFEDGVDVTAIGENVGSRFDTSNPDEKFTIFWNPSIRTSAPKVSAENKGDLWIFTTRDGVTSAAVKERNGRIEIQCRHNPDSDYVTSFTAYPPFFGQDERKRKPEQSPLSPDVPISVCLFMLEERNLMLASVASLIDIYGGRDTFSQPTPPVSKDDRESFAESVPADSGTPSKSAGSENAGNCKVVISVNDKACVDMSAIIASKPLIAAVNDFVAVIAGNTLSCSLAVGGDVFAKYTFQGEVETKFNLLWYGYSSKSGKFEQLENKRETVDPLIAQTVCAELDARVQTPVLANVEFVLHKECSNAWVGFPGRANTSTCIDPSEDIQGVTPNSPLDTQLEKVTGRAVSDHPRFANGLNVVIQCFSPDKGVFAYYFAKKHSSVFNPLLYRPAIVSRTGRIVKRMLMGTEPTVAANVATRVCQHLFLKSTSFHLKPENGDCVVKLFKTSRKPEGAQELSTQSICLDLTDKPEQFETGPTKAKVEAATVDKEGKTVIKCGIDHTGTIEHGIALYTIATKDSDFGLGRFNHVGGHIFRVQEGPHARAAGARMFGVSFRKKESVDPKIALRVCAILANRQRDLLAQEELGARGKTPAEKYSDNDSDASTVAGSVSDDGE